MKNHFLKNKDYVLDLKKYQNQITLIEKDLLFFSRLEKLAKKGNKIDCFGSHWILGFAPKHASTNQIALRSGANFITIQPEHCLFAPTYTLLEWKFEALSPFQWEAFISPAKMPDFLPKTPVLFRRLKTTMPKTKLEIYNLVQTAIDSKDYTLIEEQKVKSIFAERAKIALEKNYKNEINLQEICKSLRASRMTFSNSFKKSYGMTPVEFRHRLRIFEALRLINIGYAVTDACAEAGFKDHAQFLHHFKSLLSTTPLNYSPRKLTQLPKI